MIFVRVTAAEVGKINDGPKYVNGFVNAVNTYSLLQPQRMHSTAEFL